MLIIFAAMRVRFYGLAESLAPTHGGASFMTSFWISTSVFMIAFLLAVIGTFAWHSANPPTHANRSRRRISPRTSARNP
jgi:hypothetical protein